MDSAAVEHVETVVIGGGQAGLSVGYHLARRGRPFVILEAGDRIGEVWRNRWDSLRLFTPARFDGLDGMPFPAPPDSFPTKDEMADYLEAYADHFGLPVRTGVRVDTLSREGDRFILQAGQRRLVAANVVVAMANFQRPKVPEFASRLDSSIVSLHSSQYRNPAQLRPGAVLIVGAGNSGAEIAAELAGEHQVHLAGREVGQIPFRIEGRAGRLVLGRLVIRGVFHRVLTVRTPVGRKVRAKVLVGSGPLIRTKRADLAAAGVEFVGRVVDVADGQPVLADGRTLPVANVIWCTGFHPGFSWIDLPVLGEHEPRHERGLVPDVPGLYFVGLHFLYAMSSAMIHGVGRDARRIAAAIASASGSDRRSAAGAPAARTAN
ncbi:MAG TPA: FAD-dependent oxidoreductase [Micromonosporaceae bacterium]